MGLVHLGYPLKQVCGLRHSILPGLAGKLPPLSRLPVLLLFSPAQPLHGVLLHLQGIGPLGPHMFAPQLLAQSGELPSMDPLLLRRAHKQQLHHRQPIPVGRSRRQHIPAAGQIFLRQPPGQIFQSTAGHIHTKRLLLRCPLFHLVLPVRTKLHTLSEILLDFNNFFTEYPACPCLSPGERV